MERSTYTMLQRVVTTFGEGQSEKDWNIRKQSWLNKRDIYNHKVSHD